MTGTFLNIATVLLGGILGLIFGARIPDHLKATVISGLGLFTMAMGLQMFLNTENPLIVLGSLLIGTLLGEWWKIEDGLQNFGKFLEQRFSREGRNDSNKFVRGFLTASLLFCVGPLTILGSIQNGLTGDYQLLAIKSLLDGFAAMAFASALGWGVGFSVITILVYQGGLSLLASSVEDVFTPEVVAAMTAAGGLMILAIGLRLLELRKIRVGNLLPALVLAPAAV